MRIAFLIFLFVVLGALVVGLNSCASQKTTDPNTGVVTETRYLDPAVAALLGQGLQTYPEIKRPQPKVEGTSAK